MSRAQTAPTASCGYLTRRHHGSICRQEASLFWCEYHALAAISSIHADSPRRLTWYDTEAVKEAEFTMRKYCARQVDLANKNERHLRGKNQRRIDQCAYAKYFTTHLQNNPLLLSPLYTVSWPRYARAPCFVCCCSAGWAHCTKATACLAVISRSCYFYMHTLLSSISHYFVNTLHHQQLLHRPLNGRFASCSRSPCYSVFCRPQCF